MLDVVFVSAKGEKGKAITNAIMFMITKDNLPLNTVEKVGFKHLMKTTCPLYKIPAETQFTKLIEGKYIAMKQIMKNKLNSASSVCLTTDIWTEMMRVKSYLGITCHFIAGK